MATKLDRVEIEAKMGKVFRKLSVEECKLIQGCLQSIADERNEALGHVEHLQSENTKLTESTAALLARCVALEASNTPHPMSEAPEEGTRLLECYSNGERHIAWYSLVPDPNRIGWLPALPDPETKAP